MSTLGPFTVTVLPVGIVIDWPAITQASPGGVGVYDGHSVEAPVLIFWVISVSDDSGGGTQMCWNVPRQSWVGGMSIATSTAASIGLLLSICASTGNADDENPQPTRASARGQARM